MVITDFHVVRIVVIAPNKADTVLIVDPYAVLAAPVSPEGLKPVTRRMSEIFHYLGGIQHFELSGAQACCQCAR